MEPTLVPGRGYEVAWVNFAGLRGKGFAAYALLPLRLLLGFWQAARAIFAPRPDVLLGMGGYQSFPGGMMAALFGRPLVIHEQNSVAGLANRVLAGVADRILCGFPRALKNGAAAGVARILFPSPHAVDDPQTGSARPLARAGAAILLPQPELTPERLAGL